METRGMLLVAALVGVFCPTVAGETPFADLSVAEMNEVIEYLFQQTTLNLVRQNKAKMTDSLIFLIEAIRPPKTATLRYLDGSGPLPERAARVVVQRGDLPVPEMQEYKVYPIPKPANIDQIRNAKWRDPIPFKSIWVSRPQLAALETLIVHELTPVHHIILDISGGFGYFNCSKKCLSWNPGVPAHVESGHQKVVLALFRNVEGYHLHPIGVQFLVNMDEIDPSRWFVEKVWIQGQYFKDFNEVLQAKNKNELNITKLSNLDSPPGGFLMSSLNFRGEPRPSTPQRKPHTVMPDGRRFSVVDRNIKWMGWEFEFSMLTSSGIQIQNVKFLKERIAYELSLQEIMVFYGGGSPMPRHSTYYDSHVILGTQTSQLFPGIDCPSHAQFFDFVHLFAGRPHVFPNGACVFEHDRGVPLRRHYSNDHAGSYHFAQGIPDTVLIFRHILSIYNYEYIIDFMFHQAGQIESKVTLSGYVLSTFYTGPEMNKYGYVLNEPTSIGNLHHHVLHLKADLDIKGTVNRFETLDIQLENITDEINEGETLLNRYFTRNLKRTEREAAYKFNFSNPKYLIMFNEREKNKFGNSKGYRIVSDAMSKLLLPNSNRGFRSRAWTTYQLAVTKQNENEQFSSSIYALMEPYDPVMSFEDYISDDEDIVDQDLVAWITLGTHHIPHSEDVPIVTTPGVQMTFYLLPYNYFDEDPSLASRDNIRVSPGENGPVYEYSGVSGEGACPEVATCAPPPPSPTSGTTALAPFWALLVGICSIIIRRIH